MMMGTHFVNDGTSVIVAWGALNVYTSKASDVDISGFSLLFPHQIPAENKRRKKEENVVNR